MRRFGLFFLAGAMAYLSAIIFAPASYAYRGMLGEARNITGVRVDGRLSEWRGILTIRLESASQCTVGAAKWQGPADASGRFGIAYDDRYLYLAGEVRDDRLVNDQAGILMWNGDCVQIFLDADPEGDANDHTYSSDDYHLGLTPGTDGRRPGWTSWQPPGGRVRPQVAVERTADGYTFEMALPLDQLGIRAAPGTAVGLGITLIDSDTPGEVKSQMSSAPDAWRDPSVLGRVVFR